MTVAAQPSNFQKQKREAFISPIQKQQVADHKLVSIPQFRRKEFSPEPILKDTHLASIAPQQSKRFTNVKATPAKASPLVNPEKKQVNLKTGIPARKTLVRPTNTTTTTAAKSNQDTLNRTGATIGTTKDKQHPVASAKIINQTLLRKNPPTSNKVSTLKKTSPSAPQSKVTINNRHNATASAEQPNSNNNAVLAVQFQRSRIAGKQEQNPHLANLVSSPTVISSPDQLHSRLSRALAQLHLKRHTSEEDLKQSLSEIQSIVKLDDGVITAEARSFVWRSCMLIQDISLEEYEGYLAKGFHPDYIDKIDFDVDRTLKGLDEFQQKVGLAKLTRLLHSFIWLTEEVGHLDDKLRFTYVQGMNVHAATFAIVMDELSAFYSIAFFWRHICPMYVQPNVEGVSCGQQLLAICLHHLDPDLYKICVRDKLANTLWSHVMTFMSNMKPFDQVLKLWDYYISHGFHLNILAIVAFLMMMRDVLIAGSKDGFKYIRDAKLDGVSVIKIVERLRKKISVPLMELLKCHLHDQASFQLVSNYHKSIIEKDEFDPR